MTQGSTPSVSSSWVWAVCLYYRTAAFLKIIAPYVQPVAELHGQWDCRPTALDAYTKAISYDGKFPFAYYYSATCRKAAGAEDWQQDIQKSRDILLKTTRLPGHHPDHDALLKRINDGNLTNSN